MRRIVFTVLLVFTLILSAAALAEEYTPRASSVTINSSNFPDAIFREYVRDEFDLNGDGKLSSSEIAQATEINLEGESIEGLDGIKYFTALDDLILDNCDRLITLDLSKNTALTSLTCWNCNLVSLNISNCTKLEILYCEDNHLKTLDVSKCTNLKELYCSDNLFTSLDLSKCTSLQILDCSVNYDLNSLNLTNCQNLKELNVFCTSLSSLDLSGCPNLHDLNCADTNLSSIVITDCSRLVLAAVKGTYTAEYEYYNWFYLEDYTVKRYDYMTTTGINCVIMADTNTSIGYTIALDEAHFPDAYFRNCLDIYDINSDGVLSQSERRNITDLVISDHYIRSLKGIEYLTSIESLYCNNNAISSIDLSNNKKLVELSCYNNDLTSLDLSKNTELVYVSCEENELTKLNVSGCTKLEMLYCHDNSLETLNVTKCTKLVYLHCDRNKLSELNVGNCKKLESLYCYDNLLHALNVTNCTMLEDLGCSENFLTELDVSKCKKLGYLTCYINNIAALDIGNCPDLYYLDCESNPITTLDLNSCPMLIEAVQTGTKTVYDSSVDYQSSSGYRVWVSSTTRLVYDMIDSGILQLPTKLTTIEAETFMGATMASVVCPSSLTSIGARAFKDCANMTDIYIPDTVTYIGDNAFLNCANLTIHAPSGSLAAAYAKTHSISYETWD